MTERHKPKPRIRVLFWREPPMPGLEPQDCIDLTVLQQDRDDLAAILRGGSMLMGYMGFASCRMCGRRLGTRDLGTSGGWNDGYMWPESAEHYVLEHRIWTSECALLLESHRRQSP